MIAKDIGLAILEAIPLQGPGANVDEIHRAVRRALPGVTREAVESFLNALVRSRAAWFNGPADDRQYVRYH
jgi:hypothetical protein